MPEACRDTSNLVKKGSKMWARLAASIPTPVSLTRISARAVGKAFCRQTNRAVVGRKLDGVEQQLVDGIANFVFLDENRAEIGGSGDFQFLLPLCRERAHILGGAVHQARQRHVGSRQRSLETIGQEQLDHEVDPLIEANAADVNPLQPFADVWRHAGRLPAQVGQAHDNGQRGPQFVAGNFDERFFEAVDFDQFLIGFFQLLVLLLHFQQQPFAVGHQVVVFHRLMQNAQQLLRIERLGDVAVDAALVDGVDTALTSA